MVSKVIGFYVNAGTGAVRLALNVTSGTLKLVGGVAERAMGVSRAPSGEPGYKPAAAAKAKAASEAPAETAEPEGASPEPALEPEPEPEPDPAAPASEPAAPEPSAETAEPAPPEDRPPAIDYDAAPRTPIDRAEEVAKTVDEEPELVAEFAERGAENGAGANATIDEPWKGYAQMSADAIIARIGEADLAELAVVELYEQAHRKRQTVLQAAERRHRSLTGPGAAQ